MSLRIQNNVEAFNAQRQVSATAEKVSKAMERLSSGYRINRGAEDAAGLAISEKLRGQISGLTQANRNSSDAISLVQTAEGALNEVHSMLQRVRELAVQFKNGTLSGTNQQAIQSEINQLASEVDRIGSSAQFNGISLLDGTAGGSGAVTFQVGANDSDTLSISFPSLSSKVGTAWVNLQTATLSDIDSAIDAVTDVRSGFGATQNRLEHALSVTAVYQENLTSAESRIRDVDMAEEMVSLTKNQILSQAGTAMLSQANQSPQSVLRLLG